MNIYDFAMDAIYGYVRWDTAFPLMFWLGLFGIGCTVNIWKPAK